MARRPLVPLALTCLALLIAACGGDDAQDSTAPPVPAPTASREDFPTAGSKTLEELQASAATGPILAPAVSVLQPGENRFSFALFDTARKAIGGAQVAVYVSRPDGSGVKGPFVTRSESLDVKPQFQSKQTAADNEAGGPQAVYVADVQLPRQGDWVVMGLARLDGRLLATEPVSVKVGKPGAGPPGVGDPAIKVSTPTRGDVRGDLEQIDTRLPPLADWHEEDFADVVGKKPTVLLFVTPQLCASRVCGPVYDVAEQVRSESGADDIAWIQQEIYRDNDLNKGFREQVGKWRLPTEPWVFVVDRSGTVVDRIEGAFSVGELERAVAKIR